VETEADWARVEYESIPLHTVSKGRENFNLERGRKGELH
jgi:hypothetical protein